MISNASVIHGVITTLQM